MEPFWEGLGEGFGRVWALLTGFQGFQDESNFEAEVGNRKSGSIDTQGSRCRPGAALITMVDQPTIGIIDR